MALRAYEEENREIISNREYDELYDRLKMLEEETGTILGNSPTQRAGYEVVSDLPKFRHESPMLSLDKTKDTGALADWLGDMEGLLSWKMDGLTIVLTYQNGELFRAVTRGNGEVGEVVTNNARVFANLPTRIADKRELVLRGEAVIRYSDFEAINKRIPEEGAKYKNPRNLCSGAVRQLNSEITAQRSVNFFAFSLIQVKDMDAADQNTAEQNSIESNSTELSSTELNSTELSSTELSSTELSSTELSSTEPSSAEQMLTAGRSIMNEAALDGYETREEQMKYLALLGFQTVESVKVTRDTIAEAVSMFAAKIAENDFPSDGLVLTFNDIAYGRALGRTSKFPRHSIAYKWADEIMETSLLEVEWSASRTGLINPVAIFEPVELEGTTVSRASLHNVSIIEGLQLGIGDRITVYKANMIIPQVADNLTKSATLPIPDSCPVCGQTAVIVQENDVKVLVCQNTECPVKKIKAFAHFAARDAMNIDGLSEATIEKLIDLHYLHTLPDLFHLDRYISEIEEESKRKSDKKEEYKGFGVKSFQNLLDAVKSARTTTVAKLIYSLGIANIGLSNAKLISRHCNNNLNEIVNLSTEEMLTIDGIGGVIADSLVAFFEKEENRMLVEELSHEVTFQEDAIIGSSALEGKTFVITGSVEHFANRDELKEYIEKHGGKTTGSVTTKTDYLINNDTTSNSSKNKKAKELGIPILSEADFLKLSKE